MNSPCDTNNVVNKFTPVLLKRIMLGTWVWCVPISTDRVIYLRFSTHTTDKFLYQQAKHLRLTPIESEKTAVALRILWELT